MDKKTYTARFKFEVVLETLESGNVVEVSRKYNINANMISTWRKQFKESGYQVFESSVDKEVQNLSSKVAKLEQLIGKKEVELALMKNFFDHHKSRSG